MNHIEQNLQSPLLRFWQSAFARYARPLEHGLAFDVPGFADPLLSANFLQGDRQRFLQENEGCLPHFSEIVPLGEEPRVPPGFRLARRFFLGETAAAELPLRADLRASTFSLNEALRSEELPSLLREAFLRDAAFLLKLLPFLCSVQAEFRTVFLRQGGEVVGAVTVGAAGDAAIVLNAAVRKAARGQGLSAELAGAARKAARRLGASEVFFWTEHAFFGRHAGRFRHYQVFLREPLSGAMAP